MDNPNLLHDNLAIPEASKQVDTVSNSHERKTAVVKIRVKQSATTSKAEEADNGIVERSQGGEDHKEGIMMLIGLQPVQFQWCTPKKFS